MISCYYILSSSAHTRVRAQKRQIIIGNIIIIWRYIIVVSKDLSWLLILFRRDRQYYIVIEYINFIQSL